MIKFRSKRFFRRTPKRGLGLPRAIIGAILAVMLPALIAYASTLTPNIALGVPTVGADSDDWGGIINGDLASIDALWVNIGNVAFGTAATKNTGTSGATVPLLNGANTWSAGQTFSGGLTGALTGTLTGNADTATALTSGNKTINGALTLNGALTVQADPNFGLHSAAGQYVLQMGATNGVNFDTGTGRLNVVVNGVVVNYFDGGGIH